MTERHETRPVLWQSWKSAGAPFLHLFTNNRDNCQLPEHASPYLRRNDGRAALTMRNNTQQLVRREPTSSRILLENPQLSSKSTWDNQEQICQNSVSMEVALRSPDMCATELRYSNDSHAEKMDLVSEVKSLARRFLNLDAGSRPRNTSTLIGDLLEAVHVLQDHVDTLGAKFSKTDIVEAPSQNLHYKTLYRIRCHQTLHCHDQVMYEDEPYYDTNMTWGNDKVLRGDHPVFNVESYLMQHPGLHFVVVKEHDCVSSHNALLEDANQPTAEAHGSHGRERLWIISPTLQMALKDISQSTLPIADDSITYLAQLNAPYDIFFHHHGELLTLAQKDKSHGPVLNTLLSYVVTNYQSDHEDARLMFTNGFVSSFHLGKLFRPGQLVISSDSHTGASRVSIVIECIPQPNGSVNIKGWCWNFDGVRLVRAIWSGDIVIPSQQPIAINQLIIYPSEYAADGIMDTLATRGERFWAIRDRAYLAYTGWDAQRKHQYSESRFMIDTSVYNDLHHIAKGDYSIAKCDGMGPFELHLWSTNQKFGGGAALDCWPTSINTSDVRLTREMYLLLPPTVKGFDMSEKRWTLLDVRHLHDVGWRTEALDRIVIPTEHREMLKALVKSFEPERQIVKDNDYMVPAKGQGLNILLHGAPGTGKTTTAECVAEYAQKPLYRFTCGDIGTDPQSVEKYLESAFFLAKRWDAVVIMDEADVFLQSRSHGDLQRNSMVSVFLRVLEYYSGILILTTNRVGTFDDAFKSRIHVSLYFQQIQRQDRLRIWEFFAQEVRAEMSETDFHQLEQRLPDLAAAPLNGRQIRNAMKSARQLAIYRKISLNHEHIQQVVETTREFDKYLETVHSPEGAGDRSREQHIESAQDKPVDQASNGRSIEFGFDEDAPHGPRSKTTAYPKKHRVVHSGTKRTSRSNKTSKKHRTPSGQSSSVSLDSDIRSVVDRPETSDADTPTSAPQYIHSALSKAWGLNNGSSKDELREADLQNLVEAFASQLRPHAKE
ncbi:unnamed protein product [Periconia digitata]|uniref:AAA+ ATPase domain-containing protein n=1 Tax=Periconia digitata TaxID=1303443 RepID=A0A9W4UNS6_9PLEO|nr:unnamed protein product [Periconia digitata]